MRNYPFGSLPEELKRLIEEKNPVEEDIGIADAKGQVKAVMIQPDLYQFLLKKIEEAEDAADIDTVKQARSNQKN